MVCLRSARKEGQPRSAHGELKQGCLVALLLARDTKKWLVLGMEKKNIEALLRVSLRIAKVRYNGAAQIVVVIGLSKQKLIARCQLCAVFSSQKSRKNNNNQQRINVDAQGVFLLYMDIGDCQWPCANGHVKFQSEILVWGT
ncbi:hypothetical protein Tco_1298135, partial [Tanacetum coccineum]